VCGAVGEGEVRGREGEVRLRPTQYQARHLHPANPSVALYQNYCVRCSICFVGVFLCRIIFTILAVENFLGAIELLWSEHVS